MRLIIVSAWICIMGLACKKTETPAGSQKESGSLESLRLKDFKPKSIYNLKVTSIDKARFPVIDLHSHPYPQTQEELTSWVKTMDEVGIATTVVMTYATGMEFDSLYKVYSAFGDRFILFCGFDYTGYTEPGFGQAALAELERCVQIGAKGVGELGDKGKGLFYSKPTPAWSMHIDDERMDPLIRRCGELNLPISIHVAEPKWMYEPMDSTNDGLMNAYTWRVQVGDSVLDHGPTVETLANAVRKHPGTTFIACHLANCEYDLSILARMFDEFPNLYADIGARFGEIAPIPRYMQQFFTRYQDRIVYGTDMGTAAAMYRTTFRILESADEHFYDHDIISYHWPLHGFGLGDEILQKVYLENARKILRLKK